MAPSQQRRRRSRSRLRRWTRPVRHRFRRWRRRGGLPKPLFVVAGLLVLVALGAGVRLVETQRHLRAAEAAFVEARNAVAETRTDDAATALDDAEAELDAAASQAGAFPLNVLRPIPLLGSPARAVGDVTDAGTELVAAGRVVNEAAELFPTSGAVAIDGHDLSGFHAAAVGAEDALVEAEAHIRNAADIVQGPAGAMIPQLSGPARSLGDTIDDALAQLDGAERGLALLADVAAPGTEMRLLFVAQDSMELRPSGGYIGSWGILQFRDGTVELTEYAASEDLEIPEPRLEPPDDIAPGYPRWMLEDSGWWPDFPTSAQSIAQVFAAQGGGEVDGVLALTEHAMARLIGAIGPVQVPGYEEPVTEEGFAQRVLYEVELKRPRDNPRKKFLIELSELVLERVFDLKAEELPAVARAVGRSASAGEIQLWFRDGRRQGLLEPLIVSGKLPEPDRDFLMLVDANLTIGKANAELIKDVTYRVRRDDDGRLIATLSMTVRNDGEKTEINPHYAGYQRVYAPAGAALVDAGGVARDEGTATDGPYQVFSFDIFVEPLAEARYEFSYALPASVAGGGEYGLTWIRQSGTPSDELIAHVAGRSERVGPRRLELMAELRRNRIAEWVQDRWVWERIAD